MRDSDFTYNRCDLTSASKPSTMTLRCVRVELMASSYLPAPAVSYWLDTPRHPPIAVTVVEPASILAAKEPQQSEQRRKSELLTS
jgi:hypothetical protein